jgi:hypothetical protein
MRWTLKIEQSAQGRMRPEREEASSRAQLVTSDLRQQAFQQRNQQTQERSNG